MPAFLRTMNRPMMRAALLHVTGMEDSAVAERLGVKPVDIRNWLRREDVKLYISLLVEDHAKVIGEELLKGELEAVATVRDALSAVTDSGKPDWNVRLRAALRLLDAAGSRGKPVEQIEQKNLNFSGDVNEALRRALLDPTVQDVLKRTPSLAKAVPVALLPAVPPTELQAPKEPVEVLEPDDYSFEDDAVDNA